MTEQMSAASPNRALTSNQSIQASHHIISWLERSKAMSESVLDELPQVFVICDDLGRIQRANRKFASLIGTSMEKACGRSMREAFCQESWSLFEREMARTLDNDGVMRDVEFELAADASSSDSRIFLWTLRPFHIPGKERYRWMSVLGQDVTAAKHYEAQLTRIFSSIPLGILQVSGEGEIMWPYSAYSEVLLGRSKLAGLKLFEVLYKPAWEALSMEARERAFLPTNCLGYSEIQFELSKSDFLTRLTIPSGPAGEKRILGINYEAVSRSGIIESLLVIIDDRTELERMETDRDARRNKDAYQADRFCELTSLDECIRETVLQDLEIFHDDIAKAEREKNVLSLFRSIHSIKGTARIAGFEPLKTCAHTIESEFLLGRGQAAEIDWVGLQASLIELREIHAFYPRLAVAVRAMVNGESEAPKAKSSTAGSLTEWAPFLEQTVLKTARQLGKSVRFVFHAENVSVADAYVRPLRESLLHLLNNAVDHGAESDPALRAKAGKPLETTIAVTARKIDKGVTIVVEDDGKGFDRDSILRKAVEKGIVDAKVGAAMADEAVYALLCSPGFSTKEVTTDISGRGIGLDVVQKSIESVGGFLTLSRAEPYGSRFTLLIK